MIVWRDGGEEKRSLAPFLCHSGVIVVVCLLASSRLASRSACGLTHHVYFSQDDHTTHRMT